MKTPKAGDPTDREPAADGLWPAGVDALADDNGFWRFSLAVYAENGVAPECLRLQEAFNVDVNLLLFCAWTGTRRLRLTQADLDAAAGAVAVWHADIVRVLRAMRVRIKALRRADLEPFRSRVKRVELEAEQIEQAVLFAQAQKRNYAPAGGEARSVIRDNITLYLATAAPGGSDEAAAPHLIEAALRIAI